MALLRRRSSSSAPPSGPPQAVHLSYTIGNRKLDLDHFEQLIELLDARLRRLGVGAVDGYVLSTNQGTVTLAGPDCARLWDESESAVLLCPLAAHAIELRSGQDGAPTVRFPMPESVERPLRARLELSASGAIAQRRFGAFELLHRLEQLRDGEWLTVREVGDERHAVRCDVEHEAWVVDHVRLPSSDAAFDALVEWAS